MDLPLGEIVGDSSNLLLDEELVVIKEDLEHILVHGVHYSAYDAIDPVVEITKPYHCILD